MELFSSVLMACATVATAWSAYQSAEWNSRYSDHRGLSTVATIRVAKFSTLALQRLSLHATLFVQWLAVVHGDDQAAADFILARFPEPLRAASAAWRAAATRTNPAAPATPFDMPEYVLPERSEVDRWEAIASRESAAAEAASRASSRYLLFTIIFASVLFFAGTSGKFGWYVVDLIVLALGAVVLAVGVQLMLTSPRP